MEKTGNVLLSANNISKDFSGVKVLRNVNFNIKKGEIHAVIGENGAGKSTLMNIIAGVYSPSEGYLEVGGQAVRFKSPHYAIERGIALIHQEPLVFPDLDVAENIFSGHTRKDYKFVIRWKEIYKRAKILLDSLDVYLDPKAKTRGLSIADQQMVEIISALSQNAELIIMDEPTAALTPGEVETLFRIVNNLKNQGKSFVFISHRLDEVLRISDRITVLRDGEYIGTYLCGDVNKDKLIKLMIGREMKDHIHRDQTIKGEVLLEVRGLCTTDSFKDISFSVRAGEIVGLAGLVGAGRSEVARSIFGIDPHDAGEIFLYGKPAIISSPLESIKSRVSYVPEDRQHEALFLPYGIARNMTYSVPWMISTRGWVDRKKEDSLCKKYQGLLNIKMRDGNQAVQELSGGNQQKVVLAKWLLPEPRILILDEPTRGIDVGAKEEVYKIINELSKQGKAIVMISSELPEITSLSDKVVVMKEGQITGVFEGDEINDSAIMVAATKNLREELSA